ncbi:MAG: hypothetical protein SH857_00190 [Chitinophagales bacterium]|nr:hypothetical protein [Chitinophagales bacterium]
MKTPFAFLLLFFCVNVGFAQETPETETPDSEKPSLDKGTISSQFDYVINESNRYQEYKVVKMEWLSKLKSHVADSLKAVQKELETTRQTVTSQKKEIEDLNGQVKNTNENLSSVNNEKNSIEFLGAQTNKSTYKTIMWTIVAGLLALLGFFIYKFNSSNVLTTEAKKAFQELQTEFDNHKKSAREREQKLARQLQDELNKRS